MVCSRNTLLLISVKKYNSCVKTTVIVLLIISQLLTNYYILKKISTGCSGFKTRSQEQSVALSGRTVPPLFDRRCTGCRFVSVSSTRSPWCRSMRGTLVDQSTCPNCWATNCRAGFYVLLVRLNYTNNARHLTLVRTLSHALHHIYGTVCSPSGAAVQRSNSLRLI